MRFIFLIPDLRSRPPNPVWLYLFGTRARNLTPLGFRLSTSSVSGGTLNTMRHVQIARSLGADAALTTISGRDTYGPRRGLGNLLFVRWSDRRPDDVCIVPDIYTYQIPKVKGFAVAWLQSPSWVRNDFDHASERVALWTDSPMMLELCRKAYPGKSASFVPNVIDDQAFPFIPQSSRRKGELMAFPRKGKEFIRETYDRYVSNGGSYWRLELVHGLPFQEFTGRLKTPQAFLASADTEGCALPPAEAMAAGIVVVGKNAQGANFYMRDSETALVANDPAQAAEALRRIESDEERDRLSRSAYGLVQAWFPQAEPTAFWKRFLAERPWA